jgi:hypothetical protein
MSDADQLGQAIRISQRLAEVWNESFPEVFPDVSADDMLGLALAQALRRGWIEPDSAMVTYLDRAEALLDGAESDE